MKGDSPELTVIREVLEGMLAPKVAAAVLFSALDSMQEEPLDRNAWVGFVNGPLRDTLRSRAGEELANDLLGRIGMILGTQAEPAQRPQRRSQAPTSRFRTTQGPARVLVVAASGRLARLLKASLGSQIVPMVLNDPRRLDAFIKDFEPTLLLADVTDPVRFLPSLPKLSKPLDSDVIAVIWDEETPTGEGLNEGFDAEGRRCVWVNRQEGIDPIVDLIRASKS
ncbi:MAG: hypothetical protein AAGE52_27580 [Myxococcota bacterium]